MDMQVYRKQLLGFDSNGLTESFVHGGLYDIVTLCAPFAEAGAR